MAAAADEASRGSDEAGSGSDEAGEEPALDLQEELTASTFAALETFLKEKEAAAAGAEGDSAGLSTHGGGGGGGVAEDFGLSQFWYSDAAGETLASVLLARAAGVGEEGRKGRIGIVSAPKAMVSMRALLRAEGASGADDGGKGEGGGGHGTALDADVFLFEYDRRFEMEYPDQFVFYDVFQEPADMLPPELEGTFDVLLVDPPYVNQDTIRDARKTMDWLAKHPVRTADQVAQGEKPYTPVMFVTGASMRSFMISELGLRPTEYELTFESKLATPMYVYTNFRTRKLGHYLMFADSDNEEEEDGTDKEEQPSETKQEQP